MEDDMIRIKNLTTERIGQIAIFPLAALAAFLIFTDIRNVGAQTTQEAYRSPQEAVQSLVSAAKAADVNQLIRIFGPEAKEILRSGDEVADKETREKFLE